MRATGAFTAALVATLVAWSVGAAPVAAPEPPVQRLVLPNGLTVLLVEIHDLPLVAVELEYDVGGKDEPSTRPGLAGLMPLMVARATQHTSSDETGRLLDAAGAYDTNWFSGIDRTSFRMTVPADELALPLWLFGEQMAFAAPRIDHDLVTYALAQTHKQRVEQLENALLDQTTYSAIKDELFPRGHPYRAYVLRGDEALADVSVGEVRAFVKALFTPDRATLVLAGDLERSHALELVRRYFGDIPRRASTEAKTPRPRALADETRLQFAAGVDAPRVTLAWPTVRVWGPGDADLDVIATLLTGLRAGWLQKKLIQQMGIASYVSAKQESRALGSVFTIRATATAGHTAQELIAAIDEVLLQLQSKPPDPRSFHGARYDYLFDFLFGFEVLGRRATAYLECERQGIREGCLSRQTTRYASVSAEGIAAVAARELPLHRRVVVEVTPTPGAPPSGELRSSSKGHAP